MKIFTKPKHIQGNSVNREDINRFSDDIIDLNRMIVAFAVLIGIIEMIIVLSISNSNIFKLMAMFIPISQVSIVVSMMKSIYGLFISREVVETGLTLNSVDKSMVLDVLLRFSKEFLLTVFGPFLPLIILAIIN